MSIRHEQYGPTDDFLTHFRRANRQLCAGENIGGLALTYVPDKLLSRMLAMHYENYGSDPKQTQLIQRGFSKAFTEFRNVALRAQREREQQVIYAEQFGASGPRPRRLPSNPLAFAWVETPVQVAPDLRLLKERYITLDLSGNSVLPYEREAIIDFLRYDEKLDTRELRQPGTAFVPHLTIARSFDNRIAHFGVVMPEAASVPESIVLEKPHVYHLLGAAALGS